MRGKTRDRRQQRHSVRPFNEAPALCGGRLAPAALPRNVTHPSMRPPHCAGEDGDGCRPRPRPPRPFNEAPALCGGRLANPHVGQLVLYGPSMRPPHCAGEDRPQRGRPPVGRRPSMRPPHCAGEDVLDEVGGAGHAQPSMRPPHCAGEDCCNGTPWEPWPGGAPSERLRSRGDRRAGVPPSPARRRAQVIDCQRAMSTASTP